MINQRIKVIAATFAIVLVGFLQPVLAQTSGCDELSVSILEDAGISCYGGDDGALSIEVSGGAEPYQYLWSTGDTTDAVSTLSSGTYSVNVIDDNNCFAVGFYTLDEPAIEVFDWDVTPTLCDGADGILEISPLGENGPYQYALDQGAFQSSPTFEGLAAGVYEIKIQNTLGCVAGQWVAINAADALDVVISGEDELLCFEDCTASLAAEIDGLGPFEYAWFQVNENGIALPVGDDSDVVEDLCSGNYYSLVEGESGGGASEVFWTEGYGTGCAQGALADGYLSTNGNWTVSQTGANQAQANLFYISATEQIGVGNCGTGCGGANDQSLHLSNVEISIGGFVLFPADGGALYFADQTTNIRAESPAIDCSGYTDIELSFDYIEFGQGSLDNATLWYFDGSSWTQLDDMPKTGCCGGPCNGFNQGSFENYSIQLPASAHNNPNVMIGFNWTNNNDGQGSDPSFAVDNLILTGNGDGGAAACPTYSSVFTVSQPEPIEIFLVKFSNTSCSGEADGAVQVQALGGNPPYDYEWNIDSLSSQITNLPVGDYSVTVTDQNGCSAEATYEVMDGPAPGVVDFSFTIDLNTVSFTNNSSQGTYTWDFGDGSPLSNETDPMHTFPGPGLYNVCLTLEDVCGEQTTCQELQFIPTGIEDEIVNPSVALFPNPVSGLLNLQMAETGFVRVVFSDAAGREIQRVQLTGSATLDVSDWSPGLYTCTVFDDAGGVLQRSRVVVQ